MFDCDMAICFQPTKEKEIFEVMQERTSTLRVMNARKVVAELILSDHPNDCLTCPKCGDCELQTLALRFNIRRMPYNGGELSPRKREVTSSIVHSHG